MKISLRIGIVAVWLSLFLHSQLHASRLFISTSADSPTEVAGLENPSINVAQNGNVSLYLWWQPTAGDELLGRGHSVALSNPILSRVNYSIDNPTIAGVNRWTVPTDAGQTSANFLVQNAGAFYIFGSSLGSAGAADPFYDSVSNTYR